MNESPQRHEQVPAPALRARTTDTPLTLPSAARAIRMLLGLFRLKCPHCQRGRVLRAWFRVHERCGTCNFRFERSDDNYFQGAMIVNYLLGGFTFGVSFLAILVLSWPNVHWTALTYGSPVLLGLFMVVMYPVSKVIWLTVDVMVRPVMPTELEADTSGRHEP